MMPPDFPNAIGVATIAGEAHALASRHAVEPSTASAGLMVAGLQLSMSRRGVGATLALIVHVFGDLVDAGRLRLTAGTIEPFDATQPDTGCGVLAAWRSAASAPAACATVAPAGPLGPSGADG